MTKIKPLPKKHLTVIFSLIILLLTLLFNSDAPDVKGTKTDTGYYKVVEVVDGDTLKVDLNGMTTTVRLIAVNAPESVHPSKPVECFGKEASNYLKTTLKNTEVRLEAEPLDQNYDRYGRLLRYVFTKDGRNINELIVREGYAIETTYVEGYKYQELLKDAQKDAEKNARGLWSDNTCAGSLN